MSLVRTARYSSERARYCRSLGAHSWDGPRCVTCGIEDDGATVAVGASYGMSVKGLTGPNMVPVITLSPTPREPAKLCKASHDAWAFTPHGTRYCRECRNQWGRDRRAAG